MYDIKFSPEALGDLRSLRKSEQRRILDAIEEQLKHEPTVETRNRKRLRPNPMAEGELRIGRFRVFYNVHDAQQVVSIEAIGFKIGSRLFVRREERTL